jgi:hypothetical protein
VTEKQKRILKKIGKFAAYTAMTSGAYVLARGTLSLILKRMDPKHKDNERTNARHEKGQSPDNQCQTGAAT